MDARLSLDFKIATTTIPLVTAVIDPIAIGLAAKQRFNWQMTLVSSALGYGVPGAAIPNAQPASLLNALRSGVGVFGAARNMGTSVQMIQEYYGKRLPPLSSPPGSGIRTLARSLPIQRCWGILEPSLIHNAACHYIRLGGIVLF